MLEDLTFMNERVGKRKRNNEQRKKEKTQMLKVLKKELISGLSRRENRF